MGIRMIRSMTAFATAERATDGGTLAAELRAVNHRFLELGVRLPDELRALLPDDWQVDYVTALGDDLYSGQMRAFLDGAGIGTGHIQTIPGKRPGLYMIHQEKGDRVFTYWRGQSAARRAPPAPAAAPRPGRSSARHCGRRWPCG